MQITLFFVLSVCFAVSAAQIARRALPPSGDVTVYVNEDYEGASELYTLHKYVCVDIDPSFRGHISSIYPVKGTCVQVFRSLHCPQSENPKILREHSFGTDKLTRIELNDQVSSLKLC